VGRKTACFLFVRNKVQFIAFHRSWDLVYELLRRNVRTLTYGLQRQEEGKTTTLPQAGYCDGGGDLFSEFLHTKSSSPRGNAPSEPAEPRG
jgi:hypothetical protein